MILFSKLINKVKSTHKECSYLKKNGFNLIFIIKFIYFFFLKLFINIRYQKKKKLFIKSIKNYKITQYWFINNIPIWLYIFKKFNYFNKNLNILEIGSYEGLSTIFFLKTLKKSLITCVDTWSSPRNEKYYEKYNKFNVTEKNFNLNTKIFKNRLKKIKNYSNLFFKNNKKKYDIIYIDGGHQNDIVYLDLLNAFDALKEKGIIIADDLFWNELPKGKNPINGMKKFINTKENRIKILLIYSQLIIQKSNLK
jgi:predicted O-methyltransferase YrrM